MVVLLPEHVPRNLKFVEHILQNFTNYETLGRNYCTSETTQEDKLSGSTRELQSYLSQRTTVVFISETEV